ncbi:MAG TPA: T9SS type A sorting domain-containing protein [Chitinophagales bacterium]|nr:T9SS type A sorting domain-containing protein [Chitinophagales bacterium]
MKDNIPPDEPATFLVNLKNDSQSGELFEYVLRTVGASNPDGAVIMAAGEYLGSGTNFILGPGQSLPITISIYRGPVAYDYMNLQVYTYASCEIATWDAGGNLWNADTLTFSVRFANPCSPIEIASPISNWLVHANSGNLLPITIANYDTTSLDQVQLQYRSKIAGSPWLPITAPIERSVLSTYLDGYYTYNFNVAGLQDGAYEIRARTLCQTPTGTAIGSSEILGGIIDRTFNGLFGEPQPADGVLSQGDQIYVDFSEVINCLVPTAINPFATINTILGDIPNTLVVRNLSTGDTLQYGSMQDYTISCGGNGGMRLLFNIKPEVLDQIEGNLLQITVKDAEDIFGNHIGAPISWSFIVQRRQVYWNPPVVNVTMYQGSTQSVPVQLVNVAPAIRTFAASVTNPTYLSYNIQGNATSIAPLSNLAANININATQLPFGITYTDTLKADVNSLLNPGQVEFTSLCIIKTKVLPKPPVWEVNPFAFEYSMNIVTELDVNPDPNLTTISDDVFDKVAAFVNGQIRGVANVERVFTNSGWRYLAFLDVYSNTPFGETITFRIWDADLGIQYAEEGPAHKLSTGFQPPGLFYSQAKFTDGFVAGSNNNPVRLRATGRVQCIDLVQGWNWISFNVSGNNMSVNKVLEGLKFPTTGDIIKSQDGFAQYTAGLGWVGSLQTIENEKAYLIKIAALSDVLCLPGEPVNAPLNPIALSPGWNWIGYTSQTEATVATALANPSLVANDLIRSQVDGFAQYDGNAWSSGNLQELEPGKGYKLYVQNPLNITYPQFAPPAWSVNSRCYQYSMTVVGVLSVNLIESTDPNDRITATVENNAVVCQPSSVTQGTQMVQYEPTINRHVVYFNVYGDSTSIGKPIQFQMYDASEDEIYTLTAAEDPFSADTLRFIPDAVIGRLQDPYVFPFSTCNQVDITNTVDVSCAGNDGSATVSVQMECGTRGRPCINPQMFNTPASGESSNLLTPYATDWEDVRFQFLYTAAELRAAGLTEGTISSIGFNVVQKLSVLPIQNFTIKLQCTDATALTPGIFVPSGTTVFEGPVTTTLGWNMHKLRYTYEWDGVSNLIIGVCYSQPSAEFYNDVVAVSPTPGITALGMYDDDGYGGCDLTQAYYNYNKRPDIRFGICNVQYQWDDPLQQTTPIAENLTPGTYNLSVSFGNGCVITHTVDINLIPPMVLAIPPPATLPCFGDTNGSAIVNATLGTPPYTYLWGNGQTTPTATNLAAGTHSVTVTDANNCDEVISVTINQPTQISFNNIVVANALCNGNADGSIALVAGGGTPPYSFLWSNGQTTQSISNLTAGSYTLSITDANGCLRTQTIAVTEPNPLLAANNITSLLCNGDGNGSIALTPQGGTPPYSYLWSNGQTGITATGLSGGTFSVTITDTNNCTFVQSNMAVIEPTAITATNQQVPILCNGGSNGAITLNPQGGTPPYTIVWSNGQSGLTASGLTAGAYGVTITDANNCVRTLNIPLSQPSVLSALNTNTNLLCFGDSNATATATGIGGTPPYSYQWSNGQTTATATNLVAGAYTYTVTDANNCTFTGGVTVTQPPQFQVLSNGSNAYEGTGSGVVPTFYNIATVQFNGGTPPYLYTWNNTGYVQYSVLSPGTIQIIYAEDASWNLTVTDANGCGASELVFNNNPATNQGPLLNVNSYNIGSDSGIGNGYIQLFVSGGSGPYTYQWSGPSNWTGANSGVGLNMITGLPSGWYIVTITDTSNPIQSTIGWYWVPLQQRGRGKLAPDECSMSIYPNPFKEETNIEINVGSSDVASVDVYSIKGEWIGRIFSGELYEDSATKLLFNAGVLPDGVYLCRMTMSSGKVVTEKMIIAR